ncbi:MAG: NADH-quinone oxidoreductase subunit J [bacterium]
MTPQADPQSFAAIWFYVFAAAALAAAVCVVALPNIVHCAMSLAASFIAVAAIYVLLDAEFLAAVQVLIYVGAVTVLILFAIMLSRKYIPEGALRCHNSQSIPALLLIALFLAIGASIVARAFHGVAPAALSAPADLTNVQLIGVRLMRLYALPFEIASVVLLVAMVGAIIIARRD